MNDFLILTSKSEKNWINNFACFAFIFRVINGRKKEIFGCELKVRTTETKNWKKKKTNNTEKNKNSMILNRSQEIAFLQTWDGEIMNNLLSFY